jgi:hypothetical protein
MWRASVLLRSKTDAVPVLTLISSSSARLSAAHGDPHLPNLKRRLPEGKKKKKKQLGREVATTRITNCLQRRKEAVPKYRNPRHVECFESAPGYPQVAESDFLQYTISESHLASLDRISERVTFGAANLFIR